MLERAGYRLPTGSSLRARPTGQDRDRRVFMVKGFNRAGFRTMLLLMAFVQLRFTKAPFVGRLALGKSMVFNVVSRTCDHTYRRFSDLDCFAVTKSSDITSLSLLFPVKSNVPDETACFFFPVSCFSFFFLFLFFFLRLSNPKFGERSRRVKIRNARQSEGRSFYTLLGGFQDGKRVRKHSPRLNRGNFCPVKPKFRFFGDTARSGCKGWRE